LGTLHPLRLRPCIPLSQRGRIPHGSCGIQLTRDCIPPEQPRDSLLIKKCSRPLYVPLPCRCATSSFTLAPDDSPGLAVALGLTMARVEWLSLVLENISLNSAIYESTGTTTFFVGALDAPSTENHEGAPPSHQATKSHQARESTRRRRPHRCNQRVSRASASPNHDLLTRLLLVLRQHPRAHWVR
jgi:hypothetical protein